jgi:uncharacterized protein (TIRG00374 family)
MAKGRLAAASMVVAVVLAVVLLFYSLRGIEWGQVGRIVSNASPVRLLLAAALSTATIFLRAVRWRILLNAEGDVAVSTSFWATSAGYLGNNFLPARAGELVRTLMISSSSTLDTPYVLATALSERVADAVALILLVGLMLPLLPARPDWLAGAAMSFAAIGVLGVLVIVVLPRLEGLIRTAVGYVPLRPSARQKVQEIVENGLRGMRAFHDARRLSGFVALTVLIWTMDTVGTVVGASALGLTMPLSAAALLIASLGLGSALPSTPGYVGIYQFVAVTVLMPFGFSRTDAIAYILVAQALMYVVIGVWGSIGLLRYRRTVRASKTISVPTSRRE